MRVQVVSFHCVLKNKLGHLISSSFNHDVVTSSGEAGHQSLSGFIEGLKGVKVGEQKLIHVSADQAYGFYDPKLVIQVEKSKLARNVKFKAGDHVMGQFSSDHVLRDYTVLHVSKHEVVLDGNHPLAGQDLIFDVNVVSSREENDDEEPASRVTMN